MSKKLWEKENEKLNSLVEAFESKGDLIFDQKLVKFDIVASLAHAQMLKKMKILNSQEFEYIKLGLSQILELEKSGQFSLEIGDEDIHTKIENYLTEKYGEVGKKIHTFRSRNDQVLTALRLYTKSQLELIKMEVQSLQKEFADFAKKYSQVPMPGYTHMQKAMPSTVGIWAGSFADSLLDDLKELEAVYKLINQSPLGSAAGYGLPVKIDRELTAKLIGFAKVQENPIYCQNSRLKFEASVIAIMVSILMDINKFASDVLFFTTSELNFFTALNSITTGSSIMPQKRNLDLAELLRSKVSLVLGNYVQIVSLSTSLISGYNRDFQDSKKPFMESLEMTLDSIKVTKILLQNLKPNEEVLKEAMTEELYATNKAYKLVAEGIPFREAYQQMAKAIATHDKKPTIARKVSKGGEDYEKTD